tara:strand:+ start:16507 stop:17115 length:609 start_codon:yes stop_codon:yes gene_type:complete
MKGENKMTKIHRPMACCSSCPHGGKSTPKSSYKPTYAPSPLPTYDPTSGPTQPTSLVPIPVPTAPPAAPPTGYPSSSSPKPLPRAVAFGNTCFTELTIGDNDLTGNDTDDDVREAACKAHEEISHLLTMGANVNAKDKQGVTIAPLQRSDHKIRGIDSPDLHIVLRTSSPTRTADDFADQSNSPSADQSNSPSIKTTCCTIA